MSGTRRGTLAVLVWMMLATLAPARARAAAECDGKRANLDFTLKDINGKKVKLADFGGKTIVINFWATWCTPCKVEIPDLMDLQDRYAADGLQVLGISADDPPDKLTSYVADMKISYPILQGRGNSRLLDAYAVTVLPTSFVISPAGRVCSRHVGAASKVSLEADIKPVLGSSPR